LETVRILEYVYTCRICGKKIRSMNRIQAMSLSISHLFSHYGASKDLTNDLRGILEKYFEEKTDVIEL
jgi:hypothetical protein